MPCCAASAAELEPVGEVTGVIEIGGENDRPEALLTLTSRRGVSQMTLSDCYANTVIGATWHSTLWKSIGTFGAKALSMLTISTFALAISALLGSVWFAINQEANL